MNYKVTRNGQQTGKWFESAKNAWDWILEQQKIEQRMGFPRGSVYVAYYNPTGEAVDERGIKVAGA